MWTYSENASFVSRGLFIERSGGISWWGWDINSSHHFPLWNLHKVQRKQSDVSAVSPIFLLLRFHNYFTWKSEDLFILLLNENSWIRDKRGNCFSSRQFTSVRVNFYSNFPRISPCEREYFFSFFSFPLSRMQKDASRTRRMEKKLQLRVSVSYCYSDGEHMNGVKWEWRIIKNLISKWSADENNTAESLIYWN